MAFMRKLLFASLLGVLALLPLRVQAETLFGFQDGKYYDENQTLRYMCFLDNNCYDLEGKFGFKRELPNPQPVVEPKSDISQPPLLASKPTLVQPPNFFFFYGNIPTENGYANGSVFIHLGKLNQGVKVSLELNGKSYPFNYQESRFYLTDINEQIRSLEHPISYKSLIKFSYDTPNELFTGQWDEYFSF